MKTRPDGFQALNPDTAGVARGTVHVYTPISQGSSASGSKRRTLESLQRSRRLQAAAGGTELLEMEFFWTNTTGSGVESLS
jgi:hypothetical protein